MKKNNENKLIPDPEVVIDDKDMTTREDWLVKGRKMLQERVFTHDDLPERVKVSVGFCKGKAIGICCPKAWSSKEYTEIFIDPKIEDGSRVLDILAHELIHAKLGNGKGHGKEFKKLAEKIGLVAPMKATTASEPLKAILDKIVEEIGAYPHAKLEQWTFPKEPKPDGEKSKQYICPEMCYIATVKNKYAEERLPVCPICGQEMRIKRKGEDGKQLDLTDLIDKDEK